MLRPFRTRTSNTPGLNMNTTILTNIARAAALLLLTSILTACLSPAERMKNRQKVRVQERTEQRMENRGW